MSSLTRLSAAAMAQQVRERKISPIELVEAHLARIERLNPQLNAFVSVDAQGARRAAREAEQAVVRGEKLGPLHGVPVSIKSSIDVAGLRCETGTRIRAGNMPQQDAPLVKRLKAAGAIVLGNTNVPEFLMAWETDNLLHGRTNNPWDAERTPGGSSGGEAAAIAAGLSAGGVGSDGGGSIRVPAHFSGICGLKPTPGRVPATGHFPESLGPFAPLGVVGPMARTIADVRLLFEAMAGANWGDTSAAPVPLRHVGEDGVRKLRVGFFEDDGLVPVTAETRAAVRAAADALVQQGFDVAPFCPDVLPQARRPWWVMFGRCGAMVLGPMLAGRERDQHPIIKELLALIGEETPLTAPDLLNAWLERDVLRLRLLAQMQQFPVLLCPVCAIPAFRHGERRWTVDGAMVEYLGRERDAFSYAEYFNVLGNPAAVVPVSRSADGLPIGVQVVGRPWEEEETLAVAAAIDRAFGFQGPAMFHQD
ncbi:MAG TPA: amidase [Terriglobales bacterium]|nr:amidase [Terriglobales bacterium]